MHGEAEDRIQYDRKEGKAPENESVTGNIRNLFMGYTTITQSRCRGNRWVARDLLSHDVQVGNIYAALVKFTNSDQIEKFYSKDVDSVI